VRHSLHFPEQPSVLDGDDGLIGKGPQKLDLSVGKWANLGWPVGNHADGLARTDQRDGQYGAVAVAPGKVAPLRVLLCFGLQIRDVNCFPIEDDTSDYDPPR
jgi:hypothetical protein